MMKKITAFFLSIVLIIVMAVPALAAEESLDKELARVTQIVKETLGIDNSYTKFDGNAADRNGRKIWYLSWSGEEDSLNVTADVNGKIYSYNHHTSNSYQERSGYSPAFPKVNREEAQSVAKAFVEKLLKEGEKASFTDIDKIYDIRNSSSYYFYGTILLNGIKSPVSFHVGVISDGMYIYSFERSDLYDLCSADIPSAAASVSSDTASKLLSEKVKLKLQYFLAEDGKPAVLRYLPVYNGNYIVRADTGELVDIDKISTNYASAAEARIKDAAQSAYGKGLSEVELSAVSGLEGVYSKEKLDSALRTVDALGLGNGFTLRSADYWKDAEAGNVYCQMTYIKKVDNSEIKERYPDYYDGDSPKSIYIYKHILVDAKTAALKSVSTSPSRIYGQKQKAVFSPSQLENKASDFLKKYFGDKFAKISLDKEDSKAEDGRFSYSEISSGIPFPQNSIFVSIDSYDGTLSDLNINWKDGVEFAPAEGIVGAETALASYTACFKPVLQYVYIPAENDTERFKLVLAYKFEFEKYVSGVDARSGDVIIPASETSASVISYDDIDGCYGRTQIETLAKYGIGFAGSSFKPEAQLTQKDALILLLSAVDCRFGENDEDEIYNCAYGYKLISRKEKDPGKLLNRAEFVKMLVGATEYGSSAELKGIFSSGFSDEAVIPEGYLGYVAIARALGIVNGDSENNFNALGTLQRQDAAIMLYNFMSR